MIVPWPEEKNIFACFYDKNFSLETFKETLDARTKVYSLKQEHGVEVVVLNENEEPLSLVGDALVTKSNYVVLTVHTADCLPLLAYSDSVIGSCHAGWRGLSAGVIENWINKMSQTGAKKNKLKVAIGPSIGPCHFEVGVDVGKQILSGLSEGQVKMVTSTHPNTDKIYIDLRAIAHLRLMRVGVEKENISIFDDCTFCKPELYFSYRRDGDKKGHRLEGLIVKRPHS